MKAIAEEPVKSQKASVPLTGREYLESLNDGREVWIYGEKVKDVTKHPAFRNSCRMIARLYDAL
ncbi:MAG: Pyoverdin chromophore biosynthetic protein pvcC, partial [Verrucomicrobia bacterium]|nr:Pyoverdin chromophore biosynthetic protein pvcC [Verrucomicrobiota bacterium]